MHHFAQEKIEILCCIGHRPILFTSLNLSAAQVGLQREIPHILTEGGSVGFFVEMKV